MVTASSFVCLGALTFKGTFTSPGEVLSPCVNNSLPHLLLLLPSEVDSESSTSTRSRSRRTARSRRTMLLVMRGLYPRGSIDRLHIGHSELTSDKNSSMHSGWKMWPHGSSRITVDRCS